ncbi:MAG: hypothetical protein ACJAVK_000140, partial [Akkermansiaceae bacterium]
DKGEDGLSKASSESVLNEFPQAGFEYDLAVHFCVVDVGPTLSVTSDEALFFEVSHDREGGRISAISSVGIHHFMYGSDRTWSFVPEDGERVELLWGWFVVVWH